MKKFEIDARELECPKPLLRTKQAIESEEFDTLSVRVSNVPAKENVTRYLKHAGFHSISTSGSVVEGEIVISAVRGEDSESGETAVSAPSRETEKSGMAAEAGGKTVLIASSRIGMGKKELGRLLLKGYLYTLTQLETPPHCLIFMNTGVRVVLEDSDSLDDLKALEEKGVEILVCGTCLDYMNVREKMVIGRISNMYDIAEKLHENRGVLSFT